MCVLCLSVCQFSDTYIAFFGVLFNEIRCNLQKPLYFSKLICNLLIITLILLVEFLVTGCKMLFNIECIM